MILPPMRTRFFNVNIISEDELEELIGRLLNDLHVIYRLRVNAPQGADYDRKEQAAFLQLRQLQEIFPKSKHTHIRVKISYHRWGKTHNKGFPGIKVIYDKEEKE